MVDNPRRVDYVKITLVLGAIWLLVVATFVVWEAL